MSPRRGTPIVVSAPSGTGKTTLCRSAVRRDPALFFSISYTTRMPRPGERPDRDYHFVSCETFTQMAARGAFLESARYGGNWYGTEGEELDAHLAAGRDVLLEIETEGARQVRAARPDAFPVFVLPPTWNDLRERLLGRGTDGPAAIQQRLARAAGELREALHFRAFVVNGELEESVSALLDIVAALRAGTPERAADRYSFAAARARVEPGLAARLTPGDAMGSQPLPQR